MGLDFTRLRTLPAKAVSSARFRLRNALILNGLRDWSRPASALTSQQESADTETMFVWAREYLSKPHPQLGRKGLVCPFVPKSLNENRFLMTLRYDVTGPDVDQVSRTLLESVHLFEKRFAQVANKDQFNSLLMVFPAMAAEHGTVVDEVHTRHKTHLMRRGIMLSQFHPNSDKKAIWNDAFEAYKSPFPCIVIRHMGIHDIAFLAHNKGGFAQYRQRFGERYATGKVTNDHGYVDMYNEACKRFG